MPLNAIRRDALAALKPAPRLPLSEWIQRDMRLPEGVSATPGRVRLWTPQIGIADAISDSAYERVTLVKPVRVGFTTLLSGAVASYVANEPSPIMVLLPTESDCRDYMVSDLEPIFDASPVLSGLMAADADEAGRSTLLSRRFPGGSLKVVAAKSPRNLRRHNIRVLLMDEVDAMEATAAEGSPITLAERRTLSFTNRKIILGSTPTIEETSNVLRSYANSDKRVFEVPCPECGAFNEILWRHIKWENGDPETAAYLCPHCDTLIPERMKAQMVADGRWMITAPHVKRHAGFRLNALVSTLPNASWSRLVAEWQAAQGHPDQLQVFVNTILAEGWRDATDEADPSALASRAERFDLIDIPPDVLSVTAGVDVQRHDRLEVTFMGHSRDTAFILNHAVIWGNPGDDSTWHELDELLKSTFKHPNGGTLRVDATVIDSGDGAWTQKVYDFCRPRFGRKVLAGKGAGGTRPPLTRSGSKTAMLFIIGVDGLKRQIYQRLASGTSIRFSDTLEPVYYEQLASERLRLTYVKGAPVRKWERIPGRDAEALDCCVYALAARHALSFNMDRREMELASPAAPKKPQTVIRSSWLDGGR